MIAASTWHPWSWRKWRSWEFLLKTAEDSHMTTGQTWKPKIREFEPGSSWNPWAVFVPCGAHTLNFILCDVGKGSLDAMSYFGVLQKLYTLFSASTHRWATLKNHVSITLKMQAETRWESKVKSVDPMRYQGAVMREALIEVGDNTKDPAIKAEAESLSEEVGRTLQQLHSCLVWCAICNTACQQTHAVS